MNRNELIVDQMNRAYSSSPWHGPSLLETLEDVTADMAASRALANTHNIWELVLHLAAWKDIVRRRMDSATPVIASDEENFPAMPSPTSDNWQAAKERLQRAHDQLVERVRKATPEALEKIVPGKDYDYVVMLMGIPQHDDYHAGQISLLKKAARSRASGA